MPEDRPLFVLKWDREVLLVTLLSALASLTLPSVAQDTLSWNVPYFLGYAASIAFFSILVPLILNGRGTLKVREIRFYDGSIEVSGFRFEAEYDYEDISMVRLKPQASFFGRDIIAFEIKYLSHEFQVVNPLNKELNTDLYTWMTVKAPPASIRNGSTLNQQGSSEQTL